MTAVGNIEFKVQRRVSALFQDHVGYEYLGDWAGPGGQGAPLSTPMGAGTEPKSESGR